MMWIKACAMLTLFHCCCATVLAQQFQLSAPGLNLQSEAFRSDAKLEVIDAQGTVNLYLRDLDYDSADGDWIGYRNQQNGRVLRWPSSNSGSLQIGTPLPTGIQFKPSLMQIRSRTDPAMRPPNVLPSPDIGVDPTTTARNAAEIHSPLMARSQTAYQGQSWKSLSSSDLFSRVISSPIQRLPSSQAIHLVSFDASGAAWAMSQVGTRLGCVSQMDAQAMWWIAPAGPGLVRLQMQHQGQVWAVSAMDLGALKLESVSQNPRQLWRVSPGHLQPNQYLLENAFFVGQYLTHLGGGRLGTQRLLAVPTQFWVPLMPPPTVVPLLQPFWRSVSREIQPNPPLPPAEVQLLNSHRYALIVLIGDLRNGQVVQQVRIEPQNSTTITVDRDPGSTLVEVIETTTVAGTWNRQEFRTQLPPVNLYDLSVYEEFLQSIAIDRTGKSPNTIEDVNYQPKSLGLLALPAGAALPERGQLDLYLQAKAADNAGAVRRLDPKRLEKPKIDPLESILEGLQQKNPSSQPRSF